MPEHKIDKEYLSKEPFTAKILVKQESYYLTRMQDNGYPTKVIHVDGGILLKITITAPTLEKLRERINGHISLI